jgi:BirA family transcriptional regulator, biotin operon repressor / biotin---[acetyl-CoA-carboxylase] ligase
MTAHDFGVLRELADGEFHSGNGLARTLGISRSTVFNAVKSLGDAGVDVFRVKARGYRLARPISLLDAAAIAQHSGPTASSFDVEVLERADSTNTLLLGLATEGARTGKVLVAEWQQHGRGRMQRAWHAPIGGALTFSVLWRFQQGAAGLGGLSLAVGLALARAISTLGVRDIQLKWPNDLLWRHRKLGGVLIEMQGDALGPSAVVIGAGINVRLPHALRRRIDQPTSDLETALGRTVDRNAVLGAVLRELASVLDTFAECGFLALREEWQRYHAYDRKQVTIRRPDGTVEAGLLLGVDRDGALLFDGGRGTMRLHSAEISVRPANDRQSRAVAGSRR